MKYHKNYSRGFSDSWLLFFNFTALFFQSLFKFYNFQFYSYFWMDFALLG